MTKKQQLLIGAHTSAAGGAYNALEEGVAIGATTVQLFTANQKRWEGKPLSDEAVARWYDTLERTKLQCIMSHDSYLINLGSPKADMLEKSRQAFRQEVERCQKLSITYCNFHPGASLDSTEEQCLDKIVESLLLLEDLIDKGPTTLLLETTAGQGTAVGWKFEHLAYIINRVEKKIRIGVCLDTCHSFVAGYDLRTKECCERTFAEFDNTVGLKHLKAFHLNDSVKGLGSRVDRHKPLGEGEIGLECFRYLMQNERFSSLPKYLETPGGPPLWTKEIAMLKQFVS